MSLEPPDARVVGSDSDLLYIYGVAVFSLWRERAFAAGFDEYYEESQYARRELLLPLRRLPWP